MIPWKDVSEFPLIPIGHQVRTNHDNCPAGRDTRRRLYIKRTINGYVYYCHNCSDWGAKWNTGVSDSYLPVAVLKELRNEDHVAYKLSILNEIRKEFGNSDLHKWPLRARQWVAKYDCLNHYFAESYLFWSNYCNRVGIVGFGVTSELDDRPVQLRDVGISLGPKYVTYVPKEHLATYPSTDHKIDYAIITEDMISAAKIAHCTDGQVHGIALLGTNVSHIGPIIPKLVKNKANVLIWLDPDIPGNRATDKLRKILRGYGISPSYTLTTPEPKHRSELQIQSTLKAAFDTEIDTIPCENDPQYMTDFPTNDS